MQVKIMCSSIFRGVALFLVLALAGCGNTLTPTTAVTPTPGQSKLTTILATITTANNQAVNLTLELARTDKEQETGLMGRDSVPDGTGMLFVFKAPGSISFWMKDTKLPLSIAFIDSSGKILDIQDMQAYSEALHSPGQPYQYALEVGQGWFGRVEVKAGDKLNFKLPN